MNAKQLKQELTTRGLSTHGLKPIFVGRLKHEQSQEQEEKKISNEAFHSVAATPSAAVRLPLSTRG
jgi:hypothetical protein